MVALTGPDTKTHICDKVHYCPNCKVKEQHLDLCCDNVCKWCDKTGHYSAYYPMPHTLCGFTECHIPKGHTLCGVECPIAKMGNEMNKSLYDLVYPDSDSPSV